MGTEQRTLSTEQVARRLGVKPATVYAYVSRGLLRSERNADGKSSLFAEADVEAFAAGRRRAGVPGDAPPIRTGLTLIRDGALFYRGHDVRELARSQPYEAVVELLWSGRLEPVPLASSPPLLDLAAAVTAPLPPTARGTDRLRVIVAAAAAADPLRFDTSPAAVLATGRTLVATMVEALPVRKHRRSTVESVGERFPTTPELTDTRRTKTARAAAQHGASDVAGAPVTATEAQPTRRTDDPPGMAGLAAELWPRLTDVTPTRAGIAALNAALILLADHDLAASTLAARVAASTRAHPYAVVSAGLAALDGPLHGAASGLAHALLDEAVRSGDPMRAVSERLRIGPAPGFGHALYPDGDPRAVALFELLRSSPDGNAVTTATSSGTAGGSGTADIRSGAAGSPSGAGVLAVVDHVAATVTERSGVAPNVDLALAAFALLHGMDADAGETIFAVARTAGWIAHALEEYGDRPSRFRPSGRYAGQTPTA